MGRSSSSSCLKMISCGSNTATSEDHDDHHHLHLHTHTHTHTHTPQTKASGDKRGWSFRKRSGRHRVLGNNSTSVTTPLSDKEIPQVSTTDFQAPVKSAVTDEKPEIPKPVEKFTEVSAFGYDGEPKPSMKVVTSGNDGTAASDIPKVSQAMVASDSDTDSTPSEAKMADAVCVPESVYTKPSAEPVPAADSVVLEVESDKMAESRTSDSEVASEDGSVATVIVDEAVAIIIQTAIRGFLAHKGFEQLKSAVQLQAVIRGHLVRRNAVETLHCIRGIAKVQALVRAHSSKSLDQTYKLSGEQVSTAKLLKNSFARQLLESTPKPKSMNIRCDPLSPNPTWGWLEKWMSVTKCEGLETLEPSTEQQNDDQVLSNHEEVTKFEGFENVKLSAELQNDDQVLTNHDELEVEPSLTTLSESFEFKFTAEERTIASKCEETIFNQVVETVDLLSSPMFMEQQQAHSEMAEVIDEDVNSIKKASHASEVSDIQGESMSLPVKTAAENQQPELSTKRLASEELIGEGKKISYGSRKPSNPDFVATQSKFEELASAVNSGKPSISSLHLVGAEPNVDHSSTMEEIVNRTSDVEVMVPFNPQILVTGSECGTELSISSTLDSPDRCEPENGYPEPKTKAVEASPDPDSEQRLEHETSGILRNDISELPPQTSREEEVDAVNGIAVSPGVVELSPQTEQKGEISGSETETDFAHVSSVIDENSTPMAEKHDLGERDTSLELDSAAVHQADQLSSAASLNSHMTVLESQGTPTSQVSVKSKKKKVDRSGSKAKRSSIPAGKSSPNSNFDLGVRMSAEHLPKDHKTGKRRNSFGSTKSDNADQEPRDSSSNVSLPSYMQATKSARAKAYSPRSSPDVHDKEVNSKKRHSLPGTGGKQGSPRVQRSTSQATEAAKANGSDLSNERKWQR